VSLFLWQNSRKTHYIAEDLERRLSEITEQKEMIAAERDDLLLQIQSQNDPKWIELVLMRRLGLTPHGQIKIYFEPTR
jgi:hypothetical protein